MLVTLGTFALAEQTSLIQTAFTIRRSSWIDDHDIRTNITSQINQVEVNTLTIGQSRIKERDAPCKSVSAGSLLLACPDLWTHARQPDSTENTMPHRANTRTTPPAASLYSMQRRLISVKKGGCCHIPCPEASSPGDGAQVWHASAANICFIASE